MYKGSPADSQKKHDSKVADDFLTHFCLFLSRLTFRAGFPLIFPRLQQPTAALRGNLLSAKRWFSPADITGRRRESYL
jgi:hypothetical protein